MSSDGRSLVAMRRKMRWPSVYIRRYARLHSYSRAELPLPSSLAAQPAPRQEGTPNQAPLFKKRIVAPQAPPPRPAHQVSRQNPAPKVAKLPRPDPGRKAKRSPEISAIASSRHGGNRGRYTISRHTSRLNECLELPICRWAHSGDPMGALPSAVPAREHQIRAYRRFPLTAAGPNRANFQRYKLIY
jgi:hypothetical protein